ncbi:MAG: ABC transporter permease [Gammaproteobacteria bacterium]
MRQAGAIARFTLVEALRTRMPWTFLVGAAIVLGLALFAGSLAPTGGAEFAVALAAAGLRLFAVSALALFVAASQAREMNDKGMELVLALPIPRALWFFGRLAGHAAAAIAIAAASTVLMALLQPPGALLAWGAALGAELIVVAAVTLLFTLTFAHVATALCATGAFYLLARGLDALLLVAHHPVGGVHSGADEVMVAVLDAIALIVPPLARFAPSEWLLYGGVLWSDLAPLALQAVLFLALAASAALFDLYRRTF